MHEPGFPGGFRQRKWWGPTCDVTVLRRAPCCGSSSPLVLSFRCAVLCRTVPLVVDPVLVATSGDSLADPDALEMLR